MNNFFSKIIQNLSMLISDYICDPVTRAIVKHRTHPNNTAIMENFTSGKPFRFRLQDRKTFWKILQVYKQIRQCKILKFQLNLKNSDLEILMISIGRSKFPLASKLAIIAHVHKYDRDSAKVYILTYVLAYASENLRLCTDPLFMNGFSFTYFLP